jgi:hypothetical protein
MQVESGRRAHHEDIFTSSVFSKPSSMMNSCFCIIFSYILRTSTSYDQSFLINFTISEFIAELVISGIALSFEIPNTQYELPLQASPSSLLCDYQQ